MTYPIFDGTLTDCEFCGQNSDGHSPECPSLILGSERVAAEWEWERGFIAGISNAEFPLQSSKLFWLGFGRGLSKRVEELGDDSLYEGFSCDDAKGL